MNETARTGTNGRNGFGQGRFTRCPHSRSKDNRNDATQATPGFDKSQRHGGALYDPFPRAGLVAGQPVGRRAVLRFIVEIEIAERPPGQIAA
jgi:hypothetical protein